MSHAMQGHPRQTRHREEFWQNMVYWRREWKTTAVLFLREPYEYGQYEKAKGHDTRRWAPLPASSGQKVSNMLLGKSSGQLPIAPERMKWLTQSRSNAQLWMCLVVKVRSDAAKQNIAQEPGMLGLQIKVNWMQSSRRRQEWTSTS